MRKSELLLPLRIYTDLFEQHRFSKYHQEDCAPILKYPIDELPLFQFTRSGSYNAPYRLRLRMACPGSEVARYKVIPSGDDIINSQSTYYTGVPYSPGGIYDNGIDPPHGVNVPMVTINGCGGISNGDMEHMTINHPHTDPIISFISSISCFKLKIIIDELFIAPGSSFVMKVRPGAGVEYEITEPGSYVLDSGNSPTGTVEIELFGMTESDSYHITYLQVTINPSCVEPDSDIELDEEAIVITNLTNGNDLITYCNDSNFYSIPKGVYYYIIEFDNEEVYFSETFSLLSRLDIENCYRLRWLNTCDINAAIGYNPTFMGCQYFNQIYLDAALFNPQFETEEEAKENGDGEKIPTFKRWEKTLTLDIMKCPMFLTDAISGIFLHDTIYLKEALNNYQVEQVAEYLIKSATSEVEDVLDNSYQAVKLKMVLERAFTQKGCCDNADVFTCDGGTPTIDSVATINPNFLIVGSVSKPFMYVHIEYQKDGGAWTSYGLPFQSNSLGEFSKLFSQGPSSGAISFKVKATQQTYNCGPLGTSAEYTVI